MAQRIGAVAYVECSALTKDGVRNVSFTFYIISQEYKINQRAPALSRHQGHQPLARLAIFVINPLL